MVVLEMCNYSFFDCETVVKHQLIYNSLKDTPHGQ